MASAQNNYYKAIKVVSPMYDGQDKKDQDRAVWFPTALSGCICDGVTSSPFSADAAEIVAQFSPALFLDNSNYTLKILCDHLMLQRAEKVNSKIGISLSGQPQLQEIMQEVALEKNKSCYQTTIVAVKFVPDSKAITASVIRCGDSAFFAFASDGELLTTLPSDNEKHKQEEKQVCQNTQLSQLSDGMSLLPGDEILARVVCCCSSYPSIAEKLGIKKAHMNNWFVCSVVDKCSTNSVKGKLVNQRLRHDELLLVPKYLAGTAMRAGDNIYVRFPYSCQIRRVNSVSNTVGTVDFKRLSSATAVLPDHFYTGDWIYYQDLFPLDANFVLSSDGFYTCFKDSSCLWTWLNSNKQDLQDPQKQIAAMDELHSRLSIRCGDDDISFLWIYPAKPFCEEK